MTDGTRKSCGPPESESCLTPRCVGESKGFPPTHTHTHFSCCVWSERDPSRKWRARHPLIGTQTVRLRAAAVTAFPLHPPEFSPQSGCLKCLLVSTEALCGQWNVFQLPQLAAVRTFPGRSDALVWYQLHASVLLGLCGRALVLLSREAGSRLGSWALGCLCPETLQSCGVRGAAWPATRFRSLLACVCSELTVLRALPQHPAEPKTEPLHPTLFKRPSLRMPRTVIER